MIILISGVSCSGKTLMAQRLLEQYKIPYYSMDHLKMGLFRGQSNCPFHPCDAPETIADHIWPVVEGIIKTAIENDQSMIIEGCYILPKYLKDFTANYSERILPIFITFSEDYIEKNFQNKIINYRSIIEKRDYDEERPIGQFISEHQNVQMDCIKENCRFYEIKSNYDVEIKTVYKDIQSWVEKQKSLK